MPRAHPRWGLEFDWLALDAAGHVAVLAAGGFGAVPAAVNTASHAVDAAIDVVVPLPVIGRARRDRRRGGGDLSDWLRYSSQGFYAYDWNDPHGPYRRICRPTVPVGVDDLPGTVRSATRFWVSPQTFETTPVIELDDVEPPIR